MFWKREPSSGRRQASAWSMAARLTILYTASVSGLLALVCLFFVWTLARNLDREDTEYLVERINSLQQRLSRIPTMGPNFQRQIVEEIEDRSSPTAYLRLLDAHGALQAATPGMEAQLPSRMFPEAEIGSEESHSGVERRRQERAYWLMSALIRAGDNPEQKWIVQAGLDRTHERALLVEYRRMAACILLVGLPITALCGFLIAQRGMRPLRQMTEVAEGIAINRLNPRVGAEDWPRELMTLAATFDSMLDRLETSFARLSHFSADLAHELRTPLNNLRGEAEVALARPRSGEEYRRVLESSLEEVDRLARMVDSLLFLARAERPDAILQPTTFEARPEVEGVLEFYEAAADEGQITLSCGGNAILTADANLFRRAVSNLISNALRYTPEQGSVTVTLLQEANGSVMVRVVDTGAGVAAEHLPHLFDRFYRADPARSDPAAGTGLGLAIVRSILEAHGGAAEIASEPGAGTTVTLHFPPSAPEHLNMTDL